MIAYAVEPTVAVDEARALWRASGFTEGMPQYEWERLPEMLARSNLIVTARQGEQLVGMARSVTDFLTVCHLADLLVDEAFQRRGIGRRLVTQTRRAAGPTARLVVLSHDRANGFYAKLGLEPLLNGWTDPD